MEEAGDTAAGNTKYYQIQYISWKRLGTLQRATQNTTDTTHIMEEARDTAPGNTKYYQIQHIAWKRLGTLQQATQNTTRYNTYHGRGWGHCSRQHKILPDTIHIMEEARDTAAGNRIYYQIQYISWKRLGTLQRATQNTTRYNTYHGRG